MKVKKQRLYPELEVGEKVKIQRKKAITEKERTSHFLKGEYTAEAINQNWDKPIIHYLISQDHCFAMSCLKSKIH